MTRRLRDAEQVVGRIPVYDYRQELPPPVVWEPAEQKPAWRVVGEILGGMIVLGLCIVGLVAWAMIAAASQLPPPVQP